MSEQQWQLSEPRLQKGALETHLSVSVRIKSDDVCKVPGVVPETL